MSLVKFNGNRWPRSYGLTDFLEHKSIFDNDFFNLGKSVPAINVKEHGKNFEIELSSPGFEKNDFEITLNKDILEVAAEKKAAQEEKEDDYTRKEFNYRSFRRSMQLPKTVDDSKDIKATYKNGILKLKLAKKELENKNDKRIIEVV